MVKLDSILSSAFVSAIISAIITWFSGDRWVAKNQQKRAHSIELKNVMSQWNDEIDNLCHQGIEYDHNSNSFQGIEPKNLEVLSYPIFFNSHMMKGYPYLLADWNEYQFRVMALTKKGRGYTRK